MFVKNNHHLTKYRFRVSVHLKRARHLSPIGFFCNDIQSSRHKELRDTSHNVDNKLSTDVNFIAFVEISVKLFDCVGCSQKSQLRAIAGRSSLKHLTEYIRYRLLKQLLLFCCNGGGRDVIEDTHSANVGNFHHGRFERIAKALRVLRSCSLQTH